MWFRTGSVSQYTRHWNQDGSPGERPERRPTRIFEQLFGGMHAHAATATDPAAVTERHLKRSVLDAIIGEYKHYTSDASPLGADVEGQAGRAPGQHPQRRDAAGARRDRRSTAR